MARRPERRPQQGGSTPVDPPWIDDARPTRDPPPPIEPDWAQAEEEKPPPPYEPAWATQTPDADPVLVDPPWAEERADEEDALRAALEEKEPPDPPWAHAADSFSADTKPIDPPWVDDLPADDTPPDPIEPDWASADPDEPISEPVPADPPWVDDQPGRGPVLLRGPIDPPWVPDDVSEAIEAEEAEPTPFEPDWATAPEIAETATRVEPDWVEDVRASAAQPTTRFDPDWEETSHEPPPPIEPNWAQNEEDSETEDPTLFDPGWEESPEMIEDVPLPPVEPSWAVEVDSEIEQTRTDPFDEPTIIDGDVVEPDSMVVQGGARRLRDLVSRASFNPFGRAKRAEAARLEDREKLIADAMRIRSETREALGEDTVNSMYRALMGTDPPDDEKT